MIFVMASENKVSAFLNKRKEIIPILFALMCICLVSCLAGVEIRKLANLDHFLAFNTGGEICAIFVGVMLILSILPTYKRQSGYIRVFATFIAFLTFTMTFDVGEALVDGLPSLVFVWLNKLFATLVWINETITVYFFFLYVTHALKSEGHTIRVLHIVGGFVLLAFVLIPAVTVANPLYFSVDADGIYARRQPEWWISRIPHTYFSVATIIALLLSRENIKKKIVISVFMALPLIAMGSGGYKTGIAIQYIAMMMSVVLIFAFIFSAKEKDLFSTNKELGLATNIQRHMLPSIFPAFPERKEFDIYASMTPAKEVGGDFYDFFLIDDNHLGIVIADVSDKGVPAALFMMASKIMVQNYAMIESSPKEILTKVNRQICSNNQNEMFVTVWLGILDLNTGLLKASNAGHEKPILKMPNGKFEMLKDKHAFVVGWDSESIFNEYEIQLEKGSKLFLYTDGVPDTVGTAGSFGRERTIETLNNHSDESPEQILRSMAKELNIFSGNHDQFDDTTMLCLEYRGKESNLTKTVTFNADIKEIEKGIKPIVEALKNINVESGLIYKINLVLDEIYTNIASYAYPNKNGVIEVEYEIADSPKKIKVRIADYGKEFNPLEAENPDLDVPLEKRKIGGLGVFIVKKTIDEVSYSREKDKNVLTIMKNLE